MIQRIDYDFAQRIHSNRLEEAEKRRLVKMAKATSTAKPRKKWSLSFRLKRRVAPKATLASSK